MPWFAIRTRRPELARQMLGDRVVDVFYPTEFSHKLRDGKPRRKSLIPRVAFIKAETEEALRLEQESHRIGTLSFPFWIYRYPSEKRIRPVAPLHIELLRILSGEEGVGAEVFQHEELFAAGRRVRITGGIYAGYEGYVKRVRRNRHVLVHIEGLCIVMLPYIPREYIQILDEK